MRHVSWISMHVRMVRNVNTRLFKYFRITSVDEDEGQSAISAITCIILPSKALDALSQLQNGWVGFEHVRELRA
jgi:hypothetical protein